MLLVACASAVIAASGPLTVAATDFSIVGDVKPETANFLGEHFAQQLSAAAEISVTTPKSIAAVLGAERQRQLLGCSSDSSECAAELAGALGAKAIVVGELAKLETSLQLNLRIVDGRTGKPIFSVTLRSTSTEQMLDQLTGVAKKAAAALAAAFPDESPARPPSKPVAPWILAAVGAACAAAGAGLLIWSAVQHGRLATPARADLTPSAASSIGIDAGRTATAGSVTLAVGAALLVAGVTWALLDGRAHVSASVAPTGASISLGVALP